MSEKSPSQDPVSLFGRANESLGHLNRAAALLSGAKSLTSGRERE